MESTTTATDRPSKPRLPIIVALPLLLVLIGLLVYLLPALWVPYLGTGQQRAALFADSVGAKVVRDDQEPGAPIVGISFVGRPLRPEDLAQLRGVHELQWLNFSITDTGGKACLFLDDLPNLKSLSFEHGKVSKKELESLNRFPSLQSLDLTLAGIADDKRGWHVILDDDTLGGVSGLSQLRVLKLYRTNITDEGLRQLANLKQLEDLNVSATKIKGQGLAQLARLPSLRKLSLCNQTIETGFDALADMPQLNTINLAEGSVTPRAFEQLKGLKQLRQLIVSEPLESRRDELKKALSDTKITFLQSAD